MPGSLVLKSDRAVQSAPYGKWAPIPSPRSSLFAFYLLGTDYQPAGVTPLRDWSGNGRDAVMGAGAVGQFGAKSLVTSGGPGPFLTLPFTGDQLTAANGEATLMAVAKVSAGVTHRLIENSQGGNVRALSLSTPSANYDSLLLVTDGDTNKQSQTAYAAERAGRYAVYGGSVTFSAAPASGGIQVFEAFGATALYPAGLSFPFAGIGGTAALNIGKQSYGAPGGCEIVAVGLFDRALTYAELFGSSAEDGVIPSLRELLAYEGVVV